MVLENVSGWTQLMDGNVVSAVFTALNDPLGGWLIFILYVIISLVLWARTQSIEICAIISCIFVGVFLTTDWFNSITMGLTIIITVFELAATIYKMIAKEKNWG